jgi:endonuclease G
MKSSTVKTAAAIGLAAVIGGVALEYGCRHHKDDGLAGGALPRRPDDPLVLKQEAEYLARAIQRDAPLILGGLPKSVRHLTIITNVGFIAGYDEERHEPAWVWYHLKKFGAVGENRVSGSRAGLRFEMDPRTKARIPGNFLTDSGYDNGHMAPFDAIEVSYGVKAARGTFTMADDVPQPPEFNRRTWLHIEKLEENFYANNNDEGMDVIDGPVFRRGDKVLRKGSHTMEVPWACYKIWLDDKFHLAVMIVPLNTAPTTNVTQFLSTLHRLSEATELQFLTDLPPECRNALEYFQPADLWELDRAPVRAKRKK